MLGRKDFRSGGYLFNFRMAEHLSKQGYTVKTIHFRTVPKGLPENWFRASRYICSASAEFQPDLTIVSKSYHFMPLLRIANIFKHAPVLYLMHHMEWRDCGNRIRSLLYRSYVRWLLGMADKVWTNSRNSAEELHRIGISQERIEVLNPGFEKTDVSLPQRNSKGRPVKFVSVGSISPRKAQDILVRACSSMEKGTFTMEFAGSTESDPAYTESIIRSIRDLGMEDSISLTGMLESEELIDELLSADVLVHPARWEAFGISVLEGMWLGLPVIASEVAALPELVRDGENGILVQPDYVDGFREAMEFMIRNPENRLEMGLCSREIASDMNDWDETEIKFARLVEELLEVNNS
ncbi:MAG: glycosyltransferase [Candidatus Aegiribacteria sp.]|nr:glycosyltransferase [Candidatus Aegiribacteria sp.]MBD3294431.1 glycosyltransferase [Candidatus Fermentibacteria bacterium]